MKITWITARHRPDVGGMACSSTRLVNSLRDQGHQVQVIHLCRHPERAVAKTHENWQRVLTSGINAPIEPERLFWTAHPRMADSVLVGFGGDQPGYLAILWAAWLHLKSCVLFRGNDFERVIHDAKRAWLTHFVLTHADVVGAVSQEMLARIRILRRGRSVYTPNGIDPTAWTLFGADMQQAAHWKAKHVPQGRLVVGMFGQLKSKKGLGVALSLLDAPELRERICLLTVGDIPENLTQIPGSSSKEHWIHLPFQSQQRLPVFYAASDVVLIPSLYDGMPNGLLEAMALGKVVVASRAGGIPDVIVHGENGILCDAADVASVRSALSSVLALSREQREQLGFKARATIEQDFTPEQEVARLEAELSRLIPPSIGI